ncbi:putative E1-E2 ATPase [Neocallimastix lanati (nom. inval.)]|jgi:phospholipid-translocating ATPase|uniref:Phospholipid-transporting ATPase n=1 Tax=Neocallimastix californiae TaxID=1754190 RepID=A0A1Y2AHY8_9FUNG|nr:putative E1-E2 ATPase [Neocallimastix sp. JGI-2020a]ORY22209.1 putative E1-E2 ATPase [Neocallimastix californiae]|eukprot:ORY22209.1 putative E1-E2 ATPase [Neocallimastix californiae]
MSQSFDDNVPLISLINDNDSTDSSLNETQEFIGLKSFSKKNKNNYSTSNSNKGRTILIGKESRTKYSQNVIKNQKYNIITFLPVVLYEQFKFFLNLYFLLVALSQFIPAIKIGYLVTYVGPLVFILSITISKEAYDDLLRKKRDNEENSRKYEILTPDGFKQIPSSKIKVGHLVRIHENQRVPADLLLLKTSNINGECFIRTDQLDGETDWKLRTAVSTTQQLEFDSELYDYQASVYAEDPHKDIYKFIGTFTSFSSSEDSINTPLNVENTIWANTVLASGTAIGLVLYTGRDTRSVMNTSFPKTKVGKIDWEINRLAKILCVIAFTVSIVLIILNNFRGIWYVSLIRFIIIFSSIIPISLRVNLDLGKTYYSYDIMHDNRIPGTIVRTSTIPEELGRVEYILTDKTGTLTKNEMELKQIHLGTLSYTTEAMEEIKSNLLMLYENKNEINNIRFKRSKDIVNRIKDIVLALALCHNVTPIISEDGKLTYEASSPDEIAIVKWTEDIGMTLIYRDTKKIKLRTPIDTILEFTILEIFPFTSETKRMGIIVKDEATNEITFYMKGADVVLSKMVLYNDWLDEECGNMARKGLRTLVIAKKKLSLNSYMEFQTKYDQAKLSVADRNGDMEKVQNSIENDLELLGLTGVEDKLQDNVKSTLELLRNAGIKIWMLTGDKVETASCIAVSSKLVSRNSSIIQFCKIHDLVELKEKLVGLNSLTDACLVIDGETLQLCLSSCKDLFYETTKNLPAVVCCRCSPTQKADVTKLIKSKIKNCVCAIGDGGNDVSMIQSADVGIGIVGKEGKQASLAADFSINQFQYLASLLLWHGRNSYKRSAALSQFIIHRGIIIAVIQVVFSVMFYFAPIALYQGLLLVGYSTVFTSGPVFSLVLDKDINYATAMKYPELYKELSKGRSLSFKTFFQWMLISVYQGGIIMTGSILLFEDQFQNIKSITFTALIFNELLMVAFEVKTWHKMMVLAEIVTLFFYISSMFYLKTDFDLSFIFSIVFVWKVAVITLVTSFPLYIIKIIKRYFSPPKYLLIRDE